LVKIQPPIQIKFYKLCKEKNFLRKGKSNMSFKILNQNGQNTYNLKEIIVDSYNKEEMDKLAKTTAPGSTCFVIDTSEYYMLNTKYEWVKVNLHGDKTVSDIVDGKVEVIYDGGEVEQWLQNQ
jgi:hypothetical protein